MVLYTFAKQLSRSVVLKKASSLLFKPSFVFSAYRSFAAPLSAFSYRQFSDTPASEGTSAPESTTFNNPETDIFIGGLDWAATEEDIKGLFKSAGEIVAVKIPKNLEGRPRGFAFVKFANTESVKSAETINGKEFMGRLIRVATIGAKDQVPNTKIFVANISNSISQEMLTQHFSQYGQVINAKIVTDYEGRPKGFGFISFATPEAAKNALNSQGVELDGRSLVVNLSLPKSKLPRRDGEERFERREARGYGDEEEGYGRRGREDREERGGFGGRRGGYEEREERGGYGGRRGGYEEREERGGYGRRGGYDRDNRNSDY